MCIRDSVYTAEQFQYREFFQEVDHPIAGAFPFPGIPYKLSDQQPTIRKRSPMLGEHNEEIFVNELHRTTDDIALLAKAGII